MENLKKWGLGLVLWFALTNVNGQQCESYVESKYGAINNQLAFQSDRSVETFRVMSNIKNPALSFKSDAYNGTKKYGVSIAIDQSPGLSNIRQIGIVTLNYDMFDATVEYLDTLVIKDLDNPAKSCLVPVKINYYSWRALTDLTLKTTECTKNDAQLIYKVQAPGTLKLYKFGKLYLTKRYDLNFILGTNKIDTIKNLYADRYYLEYKLSDTGNLYYFSPNYTPKDPASYQFVTGKGSLPRPLEIKSIKDTICVGGELKYTANYPGGTWYISDPSNSNIEISNDGLVKAKTEGKGYEFINYRLCEQTAVISVIVQPSQKPVSLTGPSVLCAGSIVNMSPSLKGGRWISTLSSIASVSSNGLVSGLNAGKVLIRYEIGDVGCLSAVSKELIIESKPLAPSITGPSKICWNGKAMFRSSVAGGVWAPINNALLLSSSQGLFRNGTQPSVDNFKSGVSYTLTSKLGSCVTKVVKNVYIRNVISPSVVVSSPKTTIKLNEVVTATSTTTNPANGTWSTTNTLISVTANTSNTQTASVKGLRVGTGSNVVYFADDAATGCRFSNWLAINVTAAQSIVDNQPDFTMPSGVNVYPNPTKGNLTIENLAGAQTISLVDMTGRIIKSVPVNSDRMNVNFSGVQGGKYLVQIAGEQINETRSIVIE